MKQLQRRNDVIMSNILMPDEPGGADALNRMLMLILEMDQKINRLFDPNVRQASVAAKSLTPKQIAALEGVKPDRVREWIRDGKLKSVPDPHRRAGPRGRHVILAEDYRRFKRGGH